MVWGSFLIAAAALKTPTRNGYNAQGVNLTFYRGRVGPIHVILWLRVKLRSDHVKETPPVSLRLPSGSFSDPQTGAPESARLGACFPHQRVCVFR